MKDLFTNKIKFLTGHLYVLLLITFVFVLFTEDLRLWASFIVSLFVYLAFLIHNTDKWERKYKEAQKQSLGWEERYFRVMNPEAHRSKFGTSKSLEAKLEYNGNQYGGILIQDQPDIPYTHVSHNRALAEKEGRV